MQSAGPKVAARQGGGFRQGFGNFNEEHLEQAASASAVARKQLTQQTTQTNQKPGTTSPTSSAKQAPVAPPREVNTLKDELVIRPVTDILQGMKSIFSLHDVLNIHSGDTAEEIDKKKTLQQRFTQLTTEQQEVAKKLFQEKMQKEKTAEEEQEQKKQATAQEKQASKLALPSTPRKGPNGPAGSGKQRAQQMLERDRKSLGRVAGAN
ncbi:MAG TPA: hypothetical protein VGA89_02320 [Patescibacteria group bacterium]|jgi:hypothetical protein